MALIEVGELPPLVDEPSYAAIDIKEFVASGMDVARVEHAGKTTSAICALLRKYVRDHPDECAGVGVARRQGKAYLYRKESA